MTISMKVLWRLKVETFSFEASAAVSGERDCLLSLSLVSLADGGRAVSLLSSVALEAEADAAAVSEAEALLSSPDLTSEESKALVLLASTPKSIKVDVRESTTSQTRTVQMFSRSVILCKA